VSVSGLTALSERSPWARRRASLVPYIFIAGAAVYLLLVMAVPLGNGVGLSFTETSLMAPTSGTAVGLQNYVRLVGDPSFHNTLWLTVVYTAGSVIGAVVIGTVAAALINSSFPGRWLARAVLTLPWAIPGVAAALVFTWIFNMDSGVLNRMLSAVGVEPQGWLIDPAWSMFAVTTVSIWKVFPFVMMVVLAALQSVPDEVREAARVDGADALSTFRSVVLPYLMPTLRVVTLLVTIWSFRRFEIIWLLTQGGPVESTNTVVIDVYREAFTNSNLGFSAATGVVGLLLSLVVTTLYYIVDTRSSAKEDVA